MHILFDKFKEVGKAVLPIVLFVLLMSGLTAMPMGLLGRFLIGALLVILGLGIFLFGTEIGISHIGSLMGRAIATSATAKMVFLSGLFLGTLISIAEPDLLILAQQVSQAMGGLLPTATIVLVVSLGVGLLMGLGFLRILASWSMKRLFLGLYALVGILLLFVAEPFHAVAFDASGATTGALTTPFILAMGLGVSMLKSHAEAEQDAFGLVGFASLGPILAVLAMALLLGVEDIAGESAAFVPQEGLLAPFLSRIGHTSLESLIALVPIALLFVVMNRRRFHLASGEFFPIVFGLAYTWLGLVIFLVGVNGGFLDLARVLGQTLGSLSHTGLILPPIGLFLGASVVLAEPAVYVLAEQVEEVTAGAVPRRLLLMALAAGVAVSVMLSMIRILVPSLSLWMFLVPGYGLSLFLARRVSSLFVGIAFDSGGVASGPMTATFILSLAQGIAESTPGADPLVDGFGIIATVAMTPILTILILATVYEQRLRKEAP